MRAAVAVLVVVFVAVAFATRQHLEFSHPVAQPTTWRILDETPDKNHELPLIVAIKQRNLDKLESLFWAVSDPHHAQYGKHVTIDDLTQLIGPSQETVNQVLDWIASAGIGKMRVTKNRDFVHFTATVAQAEFLLHARFNTFQHIDTGRKIVRSLGPYSVPKTISHHFDFVVGATGFPLEPKSKIASEMNPTDMYSLVGPADLRQRYNVTAVGNPSLNNSQAVAEFQEQFYSPSDLSQFFSQYVSYSKADKVYKVVGQNTPTYPGTEANLDIQYIMGVAPGIKTWYWSNPPNDFWGDLTAWVSQIGDTPDAPFVHSISYGSQGNYPSSDYRDRLNTEFQKMGARGISIIFASGDSGTGCFLCVEFLPSFPATSPYVTSVGATTWVGSGVGPEEAVTGFSSGGGMSLLFPRPSYQNKAVSAYLSSGVELPESFYYAANGRATPDVAALGWNFAVVVGGSVQSVGGTSASAPTFAGIVSLLNDIRLAKGARPLGFLNPFLYSVAATTPGALWDVTVGNNQYGCCGLSGFLCAPGWDPVTGLGTPNFAVLSKLV